LHTIPAAAAAAGQSPDFSSFFPSLFFSPFLHKNPGAALAPPFLLQSLQGKRQK
jgi:hypothetical protein